LAGNCGQPFFIVFNGGANPECLPGDVEVVAHGVSIHDPGSAAW
jgi:hypothetical protein